MGSKGAAAAGGAVGDPAGAGAAAVAAGASAVVAGAPGGDGVVPCPVAGPAKPSTSRAKTAASARDLIDSPPWDARSIQPRAASARRRPGSDAAVAQSSASGAGQTPCAPARRPRERAQP